MNFHLFWTIAKYEALALQRSWFFRIFAGLSILILGIFNIFVFFSDHSNTYIFTALGASIAYANIIQLNLAQAVVAIFLASEFLKQDQKNDTVEVIYVRSMSNTTYVLGKTLGILMVFLILNFFILSLGIGFSFFGNEAAKDILALFIYPLIISLPTLIFIIGLSFSCMVLIRNQAVTFILLLGYVALTVFYLNKKAYHIFDYIAYNVPMMYSSFTGFGDLPEILMHRGIYLFMGMGLIFFTIYKLSRLPQTEKHNHSSLVTSVAFILAGASMAGSFMHLKTSREDLRMQVIKLNNHHPDKQGLTLNKCNIDLTHQDTKIKVLARIELENKGEHELDTLLLSLNPSLVIQKIIFKGKEVAFQRDLHLLKIPVNPSMPAGKKWDLEIAYEGEINDDIGFVDLDKEEYVDNYSIAMFTIRKRLAFLTPDFVCLTSAINWYPTPGAGYTPKKPYARDVDFTRFTLRVKTSPKLMAVSQGMEEKVAEGEYIFTPEFPLPQLSLLIGAYTKKSVMVDSIEYSIYTKKGHDFYSEHFQEVKDSIPQLIKSLADEYQLKRELSYPYRRFSLVEVPVHFSPDRHKWAYASDAVQPEMIFYHEKGINLHSSDLKSALHWEKEELRRNGKDVLPAELQAAELQGRLFNTIIRKNFFEHQNYNIFPQYYAFSSHFESNQWPILNKTIELHLQDHRSGRHLLLENGINMKLRKASLAELLSSSVADKRDADFRERVILAKSKYLFESLGIRFGNPDFERMLRELISQNRFKTISFDDLNAETQKRFGSSIEKNIERWYSTKDLPAFLIKDVRLYKIARSEKKQYQLVFEVANIRNSDGIINPSLSAGEGKNRNGGLFSIPAHSAKKIAVLLDEIPESLQIKTAISENMPGEIAIDLKDIKPRLIDFPREATEASPYFTSVRSPYEIVVDNEDMGFKMSKSDDKGFLKQMIEKDKEAGDPYIDFNMHHNPKVWTPTLESRFYGDFVHSAALISGGQGDHHAEWKARIKDPAYYDIYFYSAFFAAGNHRPRKGIDYHITIFHDGGQDEIRRYDREFEPGWNFLGTYYISSDSSKVVLSDKSDGEVVIADAVKWVKREVSKE